MNNIYQTPQSELSENDNKAQNFALYKLSGIGVATLFGSPIAGGYLMSQNYKALGMFAQAKNAMLYSILGFILFVIVTIVIESYFQLPSSSYSVIQVVVVYSLAKQYQGKLLENHVMNSGVYYSNWRAFGISLLILLPLAAILAALIYVWVGFQ